MGDSKVDFVLRFLGRGVVGADKGVVSGPGCSGTSPLFLLVLAFLVVLLGGCGSGAAFADLRFFVVALDFPAFSYLATSFWLLLGPISGGTLVLATRAERLKAMICVLKMFQRTLALWANTA